MYKSQDLSEFDMGQSAIAGWLGQSVSKTAALVGTPSMSLVSIHQRLSEEANEVVSQWEDRSQPRLTESSGEWRLTLVL